MLTWLIAELADLLGRNGFCACMHMPSDCSLDAPTDRPLGHIHLTGSPPQQQTRRWLWHEGGEGAVDGERESAQVKFLRRAAATD